MHDRAFYIREAEVAPGVTVGQFFVVEAECVSDYKAKQSVGKGMP